MKITKSLLSIAFLALVMSCGGDGGSSDSGGSSDGGAVDSSSDVGGIATTCGVIETTGTCGEETLSSCYATISANNEHHVYGDLRECSSEVPATVRYRSSDTDCGGNASVVLTGEYARAFSVQLRYPDGTDRIISSCEEASCTPLKVQDYIRSDELMVACFGAPGNAVALSDVNHVSIKREGDDHEPPRYCIADPSVAIN